MKQLLAICLLLIGTMGLTSAHAHGGASRVEIEAEVQGPVNAGTVLFNFDLFDDETHKAIGEQDLVETHTKKLHVIVYDSSLNEFNHVHPTFNGTNWTAELTLPVNGKYFFWAQGALKNGPEFSTYIRTEVQGGTAEIPVKPVGDKRTETVNGTTLTLQNTKVTAGKMVMINFEITRADGQSPEITPYLGAFAHVIAVSPDGASLIHVHPMKGRAANTGMLHATFPKPGDYRVWVQFIDKGELKTVPLSVSVGK
ncbi:hypothetical protein ACES2L_11495 [Bdellovibrio bacteriovorus]|uniref:DUF4198 domain-containing protein n=1 Tax=Bdellovibrio reynosensis TaxID=2835041 RepID=A0ABY4CCV3_9BACT|nr:hypothetical protein [Bdellovibrio reynosensis]UOF01363.1 hypothetical protein MNR06_00145 [Bdellovibrio reynosensis]